MTLQSTRYHSGLDLVQDLVLPQKMSQRFPYLDGSPDYLSAERDGSKMLSSSSSASERMEAWR